MSHVLKSHADLVASSQCASPYRVLQALVTCAGGFDRALVLSVVARLGVVVPFKSSLQADAFDGKIPRILIIVFRRIARFVWCSVKCSHQIIDLFERIGIAWVTHSFFLA